MQRFLGIEWMILTPLLAVLVLFGAPAKGSEARGAPSRWTGSWAASPQLVEPKHALSSDDLRDSTLRQIVHLSLGGSEIRLHLSNRFGATPLHVTGVHVAKPSSNSSEKIVTASDKAVTFSGLPEVTIPAHADYLSDPVLFRVDALSDVAITLHIN